jgi:hypothetical protein
MHAKDITYPSHFDSYKHKEREDGFHYNLNSNPQILTAEDILRFNFWRPYEVTTSEILGQKEYLTFKMDPRNP